MKTDQHEILFNDELIRKYDVSGPRYTSYPTAVQFTDKFTESEYRTAARRSNEVTQPKPLSLYFHIPFCNTVCFYCGCSKIVTKHRERAAPYLDRLYKEIELQAELFDRSRKVDQLHWGGGTPTFISHDEMKQLMDTTARHFSLRSGDEGEYSIEVDPREVKEGTISLLRQLGFNRMSLGVQDFDPAVQRAVNRNQTEEQTVRVLEEARSAGFRSLNLDLIYGLPFQTVASFARTLDRVIEISPDRLSIFNYAHLPEMFKPQRRINEADLPRPQDKLAILQLTIEKLTAAGYVYIGMDHFSKPDDELAVAQRNRTLYRNFQGYSTHSGCDLVAMGITAISAVADTFSQNVKSVEPYYEALDQGRLPVLRGFALDDDDRLRRQVILELICNFVLSKRTIEDKFGIQFDDYFASELEMLAGMQVDGLLLLDGDWVRVLPSGKLLVRNICMVFDRYLRNGANQRFSKAI